MHELRKALKEILGFDCKVTFVYQMYYGGLSIESDQGFYYVEFPFHVSICNKIIDNDLLRITKKSINSALTYKEQLSDALSYIMMEHTTND